MAQVKEMELPLLFQQYMYKAHSYASHLLVVAPFFFKLYYTMMTSRLT